MTRLLLTVIVLSSILAGARFLMAQTQPAAPSQETFAIIYEPGPKWIQGREIFDQDLQAHAQYMTLLLDQGHLILGGPFSDSTGGMAIITAKNADQAKDILNKDPAVTKGVFKATVHPWFIAFRQTPAH